MARQERLLSARGAVALAKPGRHSDGGGLYLYISASGARSWVYLFAFKGKQCEMGLGAYPATSLIEARDDRDKWRKVLKAGQNPIEARRDGGARSAKTFGEVAEEFLATKDAQWKCDIHRTQWRRTLETYAAIKSIQRPSWPF